MFTDGLEPEDLDTPVWRFLDFERFQDLIHTGELFFNRADRFKQDDEEGLPPEEYTPFVLRLNRYNLHDAMSINNHIAVLKQGREAFFISCWHLFREETAGLWRKFGPIAVCSTYRRLKSALDAFDDADEPHIGLIRYGSAHLTGWNTHRFITTKRKTYEDEREVRTLLWIRDPYAGNNRHFDENNFPHDTPVTPPPPDRVKEFHRRQIDVAAVVSEIVLSPWSSTEDLAFAKKLVTDAGLGIPVRCSDLARFRQFLPN
jgi:hypothetical protein